MGQLAAMNEEPNNVVFGQLLTSFTDELHELIGSSWCECVHRGFDQHRVERALLSIALSELVDLSAESLGPEECAALVCCVVNGSLKAAQFIKQ
jgi:hypothetical protein